MDAFQDVQTSKVFRSKNTRKQNILVKPDFFEQSLYHPRSKNMMLFRKNITEVLQCENENIEGSKPG